MESDRINGVVLPGDVLGVVTDNVKLRFGPGIRREGDQILATKSGLFRHRSPVTYWIDNNQKRVSYRRDFACDFPMIVASGDTYSIILVLCIFLHLW